jgi:hypothetical protein
MPINVDVETPTISFYGRSRNILKRHYGRGRNTLKFHVWTAANHLKANGLARCHPPDNYILRCFYFILTHQLEIEFDGVSTSM